MNHPIRPTGAFGSILPHPRVVVGRPIDLYYYRWLLKPKNLWVSYRPRYECVVSWVYCHGYLLRHAWMCIMGHGCMLYIGIVQHMLRKTFGQVGQPSFYINLNQGKGLSLRNPSQSVSFCRTSRINLIQSPSIPATLNFWQSTSLSIPNHLNSMIFDRMERSYEVSMLESLPGDLFFPLVSVKTDFISDMPNVLPLGLVGPMNLVQMEQHALDVIASYKTYSLIGILAEIIHSRMEGIMVFSVYPTLALDKRDILQQLKHFISTRWREFCKHAFFWFSRLGLNLLPRRWWYVSHCFTTNDRHIFLDFTSSLHNLSFPNEPPGSPAKSEMFL